MRFGNGFLFFYTSNFNFLHPTVQLGALFATNLLTPKN